ncbi:MAG: energy transducer TonB [Deltaproteobacteria bacterium]|nr:energy transducer TonB [Deltaproteobacteria bacterium]
MTAVMRAVAQQAGPKILRIGVVQGGKVVDERLIKQRTHVTIGPSEKAMFVVPSRRIPPNFKLFELIKSDYHLNYVDGMNGRVALKTGIADLAALKAQAKIVSEAGVKFHRVQLTDDSRGKIIVGDTTFLFQFVVAPPVQPRPQLPVSVRKGVGGDIDWFTTVVAAFSFLLHFFFVSLVYSDWMDPIVDDEVNVKQLIESVKQLPAPPPIEQPQTETDAASTATAAAASDAPKTAGGGAGSGKAMTAAEAKAAANARAAGVLEGGDVPTGLLDEAARSGLAAGSGGDAGGLKLGGMGSGVIRPGSGGGLGGLKDIGDTSGSSTTTSAATGQTTKVEGPEGSAIVGGAGVSGGNVANASAVVARMRGRFRRCYQQGLAQNPEMQGSVNLVARVGPNGEVLSVGGGGGGSLGGIVPCLKAVVAGAQFAPPDGGGATISIPISFVRQK